ncbi:hypothetical protein [Amycolatopsis sp. NPDC021455]|uniref:WD40 repeat domain-containing protein n=1 Tax=Amycolatopsis sp. NPDC021455 TaxID=3154901 RepID=UPI0033D48850
MPPARLTGHTGRVTSLTFSPDGKVLASGSQDSTVRLWNAAGPIGVPLAHHSAVRAVAFSPDGRLLVTAGGTAVTVARRLDAGGHRRGPETGPVGRAPSFGSV